MNCSAVIGKLSANGVLPSLRHNYDKNPLRRLVASIQRRSSEFQRPLSPSSGYDDMAVIAVRCYANSGHPSRNSLMIETEDFYETLDFSVFLKSLTV